MTNEKPNRTADNTGKRTNEQLYALLYRLNTRVDELTVLVRAVKQQIERSETE